MKILLGCLAMAIYPGNFILGQSSVPSGVFEGLFENDSLMMNIEPTAEGIRGSFYSNIKPVEYIFEAADIGEDEFSGKFSALGTEDTGRISLSYVGGDLIGNLFRGKAKGQLFYLEPGIRPYDQMKKRMMAEMLGEMPSVEPEDPGPGLTNIKFDHIHHDFGKIDSGTIARHTFVFTNIGDEDLLLEKVKPTCGCTVAEWTQTAVAPGQKGKVVMEFNSAHKQGMIEKALTVYANIAPKGRILTFSAEILPGDH